MARLKTKKNQKGFVLVTVLWFIAIFFMAAMVISYMQRLERKVVMYQQEKLQAYFLARQNIVQAVHMISEYWDNKDPQSINGDGLWETWERELGSGRYAIYNEAGKINLNHTNPAILGRALVGLGFSSLKAYEIRDSFLDWVDKDSLPRSKGAERNYYREKPGKITPRNGPFNSLGEIFAVKAVDPEYIFALTSESKKAGLSMGKGIWSCCSVYGKSRRIDVNSASREVLAALPSMSLAKADKIVRLRVSSPFYDNEALREALGSKTFASVAPWITITPGKIYTIISEAWTKEAKSRHSMLAVVEILPRGKFKYLYWIDDIFYSWPKGDRTD